MTALQANQLFNPVGLSSILEEMGDNIKLARLRRELTAEQVAERAGISRSTLWRIEFSDLWLDSKQRSILDPDLGFILVLSI